MKKLIFIMLLSVVTGLFANNINVNNFSITKNSLQAVSVSKEDRIIFLDYIYNDDASINDENLKSAKRKLTSVVCENPKLRNGVVNGWKVIVTYIYKNNVIIRTIINSCPL